MKGVVERSERVFERGNCWSWLRRYHRLPILIVCSDGRCSAFAVFAVSDS